MNDPKCFSCKYFDPGYPQTYEEPGCPPMCEEDEDGSITESSDFPLEGGCDKYESRGLRRG